jgi:hypothetical protein
MRWFRSNLNLGCRLALIAMVLQLVLTFGHVHAQLVTSLSSGQSLTAQSSGRGSSYPQDGLADSYCSTCALIQMSATSAPSVAPVLPLPASVNFVTLRPQVELALDATPHFQAKARAPPLV